MEFVFEANQRHRRSWHATLLLEPAVSQGSGLPSLSPQQCQEAWSSGSLSYVLLPWTGIACFPFWD